MKNLVFVGGLAAATVLVSAASATAQGEALMPAETQEPQDATPSSSPPWLPVPLGLKGCPRGGKHNYRGRTLVGSDFRKKKNMRESNFCGATMRYVLFSNVDLAGSTFYGATLAGVSFTGANVTGVDFHGATLSEKTRYKSITQYTTFHDATAVRANFYGARVHATFDRANLTGANMRGANFTGSTFVGANLTGADMTGGDFRRVDFSGANMCRVKARGANFAAAKSDRNTKCWCGSHPC